MREWLSEHWLRMAQMEHASIAAFARFALELLSLGAPPALLEQTHSAMADETAHARLCFGMASAYAARPLGPDSLSLDDALGALEVRAIVERAFLEGCVGETVAALEAERSARAAQDVAVAGALFGIAQDEQRHALLAWRFLRWMLAHERAQWRAVARETIQSVLGTEIERAGCVSPRLDARESTLAHHGVLAAAQRAALRREALRQVIAPCVAAMLRAADRERGGACTAPATGSVC